MLQKILGIALLVVVILITLSIVTMIWKIGMVALVVACGYFGWKLLRN